MPAEPGFRYRRSLTAETRHGRERVVSTRVRPRRKLAVTALVILLLVPAGLLALRSLWTAMAEDVPDTGVRVARSTSAAPSVPPGPGASNPFADTPADTFANGPEGIVVKPATAALGPWQPAEVQAVLDRTVTALATARTDPTVLAGNPAAYLAGLSESARAPTAAQIADGAKALGYVTRVAPQFMLAANVRTRGTMGIALGPKQQLVVTADVVWVYALMSAPSVVGPAAPTPSPGPVRPGADLVVLHTVETYQWYPKKGYAVKDQGLRPGEGEQGLYNMDCALSRRGLLALPTSQADLPVVSREPQAFDPATSPEAFPATC